MIITNYRPQFLCVSVSSFEVFSPRPMSNKSILPPLRELKNILILKASTSSLNESFFADLIVAYFLE